MQIKVVLFFSLCFAFLLTGKSHAEGTSFDKAQNFFLQSKKAVTGYLKTGKGLDKEEQHLAIATRDVLNESASSKIKVEDNNESKNSIAHKAVFFSLLSQSIKDNNSTNPEFGLSLAVSIPVYSTFALLSSELQLSGDIKDAGEWGQVQFLQKEALRIFRLSDTQVEAFYGMGFGYGHGSLISTNQKFFAPWAVGVQWGKIYRNDKVFYRFELGWGGDFYFSDSNYSQGLLANLSLGYKL